MALEFMIIATLRNRPLAYNVSEPPIGIEPMTYALRACSRALLAGSKPALASCLQVAAGGDRWLLTAVRGHLGGTLVMRGPSPRCRGAVVPDLFLIRDYQHVLSPA